MQHDDAPGYDSAAIQEKWLPVWEKLAPFRSGNPNDKRPEGTGSAD